jgi:hypothetical protein
MGQVTRAIDARSRLILSPDVTPEWSSRCVSATIQQTAFRVACNALPKSVNQSPNWGTIPISGKISELMIGRSRGPTRHASDCVVRTADRSTFAAGVGPAILRNLEIE